MALIYVAAEFPDETRMNLLPYDIRLSRTSDIQKKQEFVRSTIHHEAI